MVVEPFDVLQTVAVELGNGTEIDCWGINQKARKNWSERLSDLARVVVEAKLVGNGKHYLSNVTLLAT